MTPSSDTIGNPDYFDNQSQIDGTPFSGYSIPEQQVPPVEASSAQSVDDDYALGLLCDGDGNLPDVKQFAKAFSYTNSIVDSFNTTIVNYFNNTFSETQADLNTVASAITQAIANQLSLTANEITQITHDLYLSIAGQLGATGEDISSIQTLVAQQVQNAAANLSAALNQSQSQSASAVATAQGGSVIVNPVIVQQKTAPTGSDSVQAAPVEATPAIKPPVLPIDKSACDKQTEIVKLLNDCGDNSIANFLRDVGFAMPSSESEQSAAQQMAAFCKEHLGI